MLDGSIGGAIDGRIAPNANRHTGGLNRRNVSLGVTVGWDAVLVNGMQWESEERPMRCATNRERVEVNQRVEIDWPSIVHRILEFLWYIVEGLNDTAINQASDI